MQAIKSGAASGIKGRVRNRNSDRGPSREKSLDEILVDLEAARGFPLRLLLLGRTGVGKSSMINALFGEPIAPVGDWRPTTINVETYSKEINGVLVEVTDTPGLCDDLPEVGNDRRYLEQILAQRRRFDCVLFVTPLNERRLRSDERQAIQLVTEALGKKVWRHSLIVFTHGDTVGASNLALAQTERTSLLRGEIGRWSSERVAEGIPSVVTSTSIRLPDGREWLGQLFTAMLQRLKGTAGKAFLISAAPRLQPEGKPRKAQAGSSASSRSIHLDKEQQEAVKQTIDEWYPGGIVGGAVAGYLVAGEVGAVIGAVGGAVVDFFRWIFR